MKKELINSYLFYILLFIIIISYSILIINNITKLCNKNKQCNKKQNKEKFEYTIYIDENTGKMYNGMDLTISNVTANHLILQDHKNESPKMKPIEFNIDNTVFSGTDFSAKNLYVGNILTIKNFTKDIKQMMLDMLYPVGSVYISYYSENDNEHPVDPNKLFENTKWEKLGNGTRYIYCIDKGFKYNDKVLQPKDIIIEKDQNCYIYTKNLPEHTHNVGYPGLTTKINNTHRHYINGLSVDDIKWKAAGIKSGMRVYWEIHFDPIKNAKTATNYEYIYMTQSKFKPIQKINDEIPEYPLGDAANGNKNITSDNFTGYKATTTKNNTLLDPTKPEDYNKYFLENNDSKNINTLYNYVDHIHKFPATTTIKPDGKWEPYVPPRYHVMCWVRIS